jgi:hypothetical protein
VGEVVVYLKKKILLHNATHTMYNIKPHPLIQNTLLTADCNFLSGTALWKQRHPKQPTIRVNLLTSDITRIQNRRFRYTSVEFRFRQRIDALYAWMYRLTQCSPYFISVFTTLCHCISVIHVTSRTWLSVITASEITRTTYGPRITEVLLPTTTKHS